MKRHGWGRIATEICVYWLEGLAQHGLKLLIIPVILSGGSGTRLWPLSRQLYPKQLLPLVDQATMLQQTALRISGRANIGQPIVSCNEQHRFLVAEQLREIDKLGIAITRHNCIQFNSDYPKDALTDVFLAIHKTEDKLHINRNFHHQHLFQ